jgi:hypothetical protein
MADQDITGINFNAEQLSDRQFAGTVTVTGDAGDLLRRAATDRTVTLSRPERFSTPDQPLWVAIRNRTGAIGFKRYYDFINRVLCEGKEGRSSYNVTEYPKVLSEEFNLGQCQAIYGVDAYRLLKLATEVFLILECGVKINNDELFRPAEEQTRLGEPVTLPMIQERLTKQYLVAEKVLPYLARILEALLPPEQRQEVLPYCYGVLMCRLTCPSLLELIWSYWHEEGMLVQTMHAISLRFQNRRRSAARDPLANFELDPLRPLNNLIWGFIQDEYNRLTVLRRVYEYDHHYGLTLIGKAVPPLQSADSRSKFLEAFHNLLYRAVVFFREDADTTVISDGFPLLNALKEVHVLLAQGAHNQFGDLPWTARVEMLIMQWLLARPEMREFLRGRAMVPYQEPWMGQVDTMKTLQGWTDVSVMHFRDLSVFGEQILLSIRYGDWSVVNDEEQAKNWARYWKPEIQSYIHSYLAVTGVDLAADVTDSRRVADRYMQPSVHLRNRLAGQRGQNVLPASRAAGMQLPMASETIGYPELPAHTARNLLRSRNNR